MSAESERVRRVADMLTTAHSILRDRYAFLSVVLDSAILILSAWTCSFAFADQELVKRLTLPYASPVIAIGVLAVFTFALSLVQSRVDWKQKSAYFGAAADAFTDIKLRAQDVVPNSPESEEQSQEISRLYREVGKQFKIPDRSFLALKRKHVLKIAVSKQLDITPGVPTWIIAGKVRLCDLVGLVRGK